VHSLQHLSIGLGFCFYALPVLDGLLPSVLHVHLSLMVKSLHILLGTSISRADHLLAENMLKSFCKDFERYYATHNCTINVHLLTHLGFYVSQYGPLWTHSCFPYESLNGKLLKLHH
jgi:hypothetical protein